MDNYYRVIPKMVSFIEKILAAVVLLSVITYTLFNVMFFIQADWQTKEVFYELIYRVLLVTIGLELARMLVTHNFLSILELLAFVVARKMLKPDLSSVDVLFGVLSFIAILTANRFLITSKVAPDKR